MKPAHEAGRTRVGTQDWTHGAGRGAGRTRLTVGGFACEVLHMRLGILG